MAVFALFLLILGFELKCLWSSAAISFTSDEAYYQFKPGQTTFWTVLVFIQAVWGLSFIKEACTFTHTQSTSASPPIPPSGTTFNYPKTVLLITCSLPSKPLSAPTSAAWLQAPSLPAGSHSSTTYLTASAPTPLPPPNNKTSPAAGPAAYAAPIKCSIWCVRTAWVTSTSPATPTATRPVTASFCVKTPP